MTDEPAPPFGEAAAVVRPRSAAEQARLDRMFTQHHVLVWRVARRRGLTPAAAADVVQQTFMVVIERLADIDPDRERSFLVATALRTAMANGRKARGLELDPDAGHNLAAEGLTGDDRASANIQLCDLALAKVEEDAARALVLLEVAGMTEQEIATTLEIPRGTVASRIRRARQQFRAAFTRLKATMLREENR